MSALYHYGMRVWTAFAPPQVPKTSDAIRLGLFGASKIAPVAAIGAARSHPEIIVAAVAARNRKTAEEYAQKYSIPIVHDSYQDLLDDPSIDAVYIPLPNGLHFEWALKALKAGKHILLEKPSTSNAEEAEILFTSPLLAQPHAPVLLESFHYRFHPAWQKFLTLLDQASITHASATGHLPKGIMPTDDIRFQYALAGGTLMDFGTYMVNWLRQIFGAEPRACTAASFRAMPPACREPQIDHAVAAAWQFPNGGEGSIVADLAATGGWPLPWLTRGWPRLVLPVIVVQHAERAVREGEGVEGGAGGGGAAGERHTLRRKVTFWNPIMPTLYHRIDVEDVHTLYAAGGGGVVREWSEGQQIKAYTLEGYKGEEWWTTYRYQMEAFVDRVKGRKGSGAWVDGSDSINQMRMVDSAYEKAGLKLRPTSSYR